MKSSMVHLALCFQASRPSILLWPEAFVFKVPVKKKNDSKRGNWASVVYLFVSFHVSKQGKAMQIDEALLLPAPRAATKCETMTMGMKEVQSRVQDTVCPSGCWKNVEHRNTQAALFLSCSTSQSSPLSCWVHCENKDRAERNNTGFKRN
jgi:hypothetical protein